MEDKSEVAMSFLAARLETGNVERRESLLVLRQRVRRNKVISLRYTTYVLRGEVTLIHKVDGLGNSQSAVKPASPASISDSKLPLDMNW